MGIHEPVDESHLPVDDQEAVRQFEASISHDGVAYTVAVPKKPPITVLRNNRGVAAKRLLSKIADLKRDELSYGRYNGEINAFVNGGHAIEIRDAGESAVNDNDGTYYMPHHQVVSERNGRCKYRL